MSCFSKKTEHFSHFEARIREISLFSINDQYSWCCKSHFLFYNLFVVGVWAVQSLQRQHTHLPQVRRVCVPGPGVWGVVQVCVRRRVRRRRLPVRRRLWSGRLAQQPVTLQAECNIPLSEGKRINTWSVLRRSDWLWFSLNWAVIGCRTTAPCCRTLDRKTWTWTDRETPAIATTTTMTS